MAYTGEYKCTRCGKAERRELLVVKKVMFQELGTKPRTLRSRSRTWLCPQCVAKDEDWKADAYSSPGMAAARESVVHPSNVTANTERVKAIREAELNAAADGS